ISGGHPITESDQFGHGEIPHAWKMQAIYRCGVRNEIAEIGRRFIRFCMNKPHDIPDWNQMRALLATVQAGSLSGAAKRLGLTQPTLGRQVAALEASLGVTIFERVG